MSKKLELGVEVDNANETTLQETLAKMMDYIGLEILDLEQFPIWNGSMVNVQGTCVKFKEVARCVDVYVKDGKLMIQGDEMDLGFVRQNLQAFYSATYASHQIANSRLEFNEEEKRVSIYADEW